MKEIYLPFRYRQIRKKYLATGDYFNWIFLNEDELKKLKSKKIKKTSKLYKQLVKNNFILTDSKQTDELMDKKREHMSNLFVGPSLHIVVLTKRCNQSCIYCHAAAVTENKKSCDMNKQNAKKVVDTIMTTPNQCVTIEFQGGEPLLNYEILQYIYEYAFEKNKKAKKDVKIVAVTNLELMDEKKFDWFISKKVGLCTSLDGPKFLHDKNRPSNNYDSSYENAVKWIKKAKQNGVELGALITVSKESLKYPHEIVDEYVNQGYKNLHLRPLNFLGKAVGTWKKNGYTAEEFIEFWKKAMDYIIEINKKGTYLSERECTIILKKVLNNEEPGYLDLMSPCGAVIGQIAYNYDGKVYSCDEARTLDEDTFQVGDCNDCIPKIKKKQKSIEIISSTINDAYYCNYCAYKTFCGVCPVCNYKETGSPISDVLRTSRCKMLMAFFDYIFEKMQDPSVKRIFESWVDPQKCRKYKTFE
ncbi:MAG: His-Xaa-Ser system radical SAM maturase HxsB [Candidatus Woesearchaeota archaeon]